MIDSSPVRGLSGQCAISLQRFLSQVRVGAFPATQNLSIVVQDNYFVCFLFLPGESARNCPQALDSDVAHPIFREAFYSSVPLFSTALMLVIFLTTLYIGELVLRLSRFSSPNFLLLCLGFWLLKL